MRADLAGLKCVCDEIARAIQSAESSAIFLLVGDIGAGKTTLVREFAKRIGITDSVTSPTFSLLHIYNAGNSPLGLHSADFANLGRFADFSPVSHPKFAKNHESQTENPSVVDSARGAQNLAKKINKNPIKSFCYFWLIPKVESPLPLSPNLPNNADSAKSQNLTLFPTIYHYDLFNRNLSELLDLGLLDLLSENGIHFVEWGDRRLFEIIKDAFENIFILQITKAKNDRIYELKREF